MTASASTTVRIGRLTLDTDGYAVSVDGDDVFLTVSEFLLLSALARQPFRVLDRAVLWATIQGQAGEAAGPPTAETLRAVDRHVARLRKKLRAAGFDGIQTMRGVGYRLRPEPSAAAVHARPAKPALARPLRTRRAS
ncbi:MAG TPA: winged helix-turn-helix domain-containing protein [Dehalococcoidia bacterium]|nr:winged helix-turn-helix domain-containing protein [Dehalococcoidia bacterium]